MREGGVGESWGGPWDGARPSPSRSPQRRRGLCLRRGACGRTMCNEKKERLSSKLPFINLAPAPSLLPPKPGGAPVRRTHAAARGKAAAGCGSRGNRGRDREAVYFGRISAV